MGGGGGGAFLTPIKAKKSKLAVDSRGSAIPCRWFLHQWHKFMFGTNEVIHCFNWSLLLGLEGVLVNCTGEWVLYVS